MVTGSTPVVPGLMRLVGAKLLGLLTMLVSAAVLTVGVMLFAVLRFTSAVVRRRRQASAFVYSVVVS